MLYKDRHKEHENILQPLSGKNGQRPYLEESAQEIKVDCWFSLLKSCSQATVAYFWLCTELTGHPSQAALTMSI